MYIIGVDKLNLKLKFKSNHITIIHENNGKTYDEKISNLFDFIDNNEISIPINNPLKDFIKNGDTTYITNVDGFNIFQYKKVRLIECKDKNYYTSIFKGVYHLFINGLEIGLIYYNSYNPIFDDNKQLIGLSVDNKRFYDRFEQTIKSIEYLCKDFELNINNITQLDIYIDSENDMIKKLSMLDKNINRYSFKKSLDLIYFKNIRRNRNERIETGKGILVKSLVKKKNENNFLYHVDNFISIRLYDKINEIKYKSFKNYIIEHHDFLGLDKDFQRLEFSFSRNYLYYNKIEIDLKDLLDISFLKDLYISVYDKYLDIRKKEHGKSFKNSTSIKPIYI